MGVTLYPSSSRAWQQARPEDRLTSRSADQPPMRMATCFFMSVSTSRDADPLDLPFELHARHVPHPPADLFPEALDVGGLRLAVVDQEVAVHLRDLRIPAPQAAAPGGVDQLPGLLARRVLEGRAARARVDRLRG